MATNRLTRTEASDELFVYRHTQLSGSTEAAVASLSSPVTGYNNPFNNSGKWRVLNLRIEPGTNDAILEFGFYNSNATKPLSGICGFTIGQPPLFASHINTIAKSIAYGFINNPFTNTDGLYIIHENTLTQVSGTVDISVLRIVLKNGVVYYYSGNALLLSSNMSISLCPLYVVGALGYEGNQITDIGISGANGYTLPSPNYTKEIYVLCNGLTNVVPRYPGRLSTNIAAHSLTCIGVRANAAFTISYPNKDVSIAESAGVSYYYLAENYLAIPFVVKIAFSSLANLTGLQIINGAVGAGTSLSRSVTFLTGLKQLEIRGSTERRTLGRSLFPSSLESLYLHGNHEITNLSITTSLKTLRYLENPLNTTSTNFEFLAFPNLQLLEIPESASWASSNFESLQNFRLMFDPNRTSSTHGFHGSALLTGLSYLTVITNLAIAQQSAALLYNWSIQNSGNDAYISKLSSYASQVSGFLFNPSRTGGGDSITISGDTITLTTINTNETSGFFTAQQFILLKKTDNSGKQLRRIKTVSSSSSGNNITYTITTDRVKTDISCSSVKIETPISSTPSVLTLSGGSISASIDNIRIGDTVRVNSFTLPITLTTRPSIVISKTENSVTVLKGDTSDGIQDNTSTTVIFDYEFSTANHSVTVTTPSLTASEIHFSSGTRAIYNYLI